MPLKYFLKRRLIFIVLLIAAITFIFNACRKPDVQKPQHNQALIERFFSIPEDASPQLKAIVNDIRKQNDRYDFIEYFVDKNGWPRWQDAEVTGGQRIIANIPFTKNGENEVNGFFSGKAGYRKRK